MHVDTAYGHTWIVCLWIGMSTLAHNQSKPNRGHKIPDLLGGVDVLA
jgi:hypothetical protein